MATTNNLIRPLKLTLISTGVLFIAVLLSVSLPQIFNFAASELPNFWSSFRSWLRPPYLYVIINGIIITIAASSRFHHQKQDDSDHHHHAAGINYTARAFAVVLPPHDEVDMRADQFGEHYGPVPLKDVEVLAPATEAAFEVSQPSAEEKVIEAVVNYEEDEKKIGQDELDYVVWTKPTQPPTPPPVRQDSSEISLEYMSSLGEKPPFSARFSHHRRPVRASPEGGKALRVAKPKRRETLESTWKAITEGRHLPLTRHLEKSETWENHSHQINSSTDDPSPPHLPKKSETFNDLTNYSSPLLTPPRPSPAGRLKKEPSLSQDELNRRVEAFINKFNEDMRLQRQQSLQQFMDMINRAS
ncbi:hypothetical protein Nepgr_007238 [Nepenthes gracilis]|uniref:DUF4408 domain-containing protein n=1 Tax=Nepenthes gracilis TaxID=150966 RepID=A0AAD3XI40_NEPGR|nr:hypothetical protein Nepgr_007238 [Nepenthes gracilis]